MLSKGSVLVIATRNQGKMKEFEKLFAPLGVTVQSLADLADLPEIIEDGKTFIENATIKATVIAAKLNLPVLADDSGLRIDVLNGDPGVRSARYAGEDATDSDNNKKLLDVLEQLPDSQKISSAVLPPVYAKGEFVCAIVLYDPATDRLLEVEGQCSGYILREPRGQEGFGYDPLFYVSELGLTMAELSVHEKNRISHRALAIQKLVQLLDG